jgi:hypothetical protein
MQPNDASREFPPASLPSTAGLKRPKRLIVIVIMNVVLAVFSIAALAFMLTSSKFPAEMVPSNWSAAFSMLVAFAVIASSVVALLGFPRARWIALSMALIFFGTIWLHSLLAALDPEGVIGVVPTDRELQRLWAGVVRTSIEIGLNLWVFLSAKTRVFFDSRRADA